MKDDSQIHLDIPTQELGGFWTLQTFFHDCVLTGKFGCAISISIEFSSSLKDPGSLICFICQTIWHDIIKMWRAGELPRDWSLFPTQLRVNASVPMAAVAYNELYTHKTQQFPDKVFPWCSLQYNFGETKMASLSSEGVKGFILMAIIADFSVWDCWSVFWEAPLLSFPLCGAVGSYNVFHRTTALVSHWPNSQPSIGLNGMIRKKLFILKL